MKYLMLVIFAVMSVQVAQFSIFPEKEYAIAQDSGGATAPAADSKIVGEIKKSGDFFEDLQKAMASKESIISLILGALFVLAKRVSSDKAPMLISFVQTLFDALAWGLTKLGSLLKYVSDLLAKAVASDGLLGKK